MMGRIDQTLKISQEEADNPSALSNSSHPNA